MNPSKSFLAACFLSVAAIVSVSALAAETTVRQAKPAMQNAVKPSPIAQPQVTQNAKPLKGNMKIAPGAVKTQAGLQALKLHFDKIDQKFKELSVNAQYYEAGTQMIPNLQKSCMEKSYSAQDQAAAGCTGNDTVNQCAAKLYKYCVEHYEVSGFNFPSPLPGQSGAQLPGFSSKQVKDTSLLTASQAKALAQQLNQYAVQAEQFAKSF